MTVTDRTSQTIAMFDGLIEGISTEAVTVRTALIPTDRWAQYPTGPYWRFGFYAPQLFLEETPMAVVVPYCADLIVEQTSALTPPQFEDYLTTVKAIVGTVTLALLDGRGSEDAVSHAENELYEKMPSAMRRCTKVWSEIVG